MKNCPRNWGNTNREGFILRRFISLMLALALVLPTTLLAGCGSSDKAKEAVEAEPFALDWEIDADAVDFFISGDTIETVVASNPFYAGAQELPTPGTKQFESDRAAMVQAINDEAAALVTACNDAEDEMAGVREIYAEYLEVVIAADPKLEDFATTTLQDVALLGVKESLAESTYRGLAESVTETETPYAKSMIEYLAVVNAVQYGSLMLEDIEVMAGYAAMGLDVLADHSDSVVTAAGQEYDPMIGSAVDAALGALEPVAAKIDVIGQRLDLLASADYYFSLEAMAWMEAQLPELRTQVDTIEVSEGVTQQDIDDMKTLLTAWEEFNASIRGHIDALDTTNLVQVDVPADQAIPLFGIESAYAADGASDYGKAVAALRVEPEQTEGYLSKAWSGIKTGFGAAKTGLGVTIDTLGVGVRNIARVPYGIANGNSASEIWDDMKANSKEVVDNYNNGVSGATTIYTANEYIENVENAAGDSAGGAVEWGFEKVFGQGDISFAAGWATGGITKIGVGMFTGMSKGIYRVANKKSSDSEVAMGVVEIGLSCIGGTKVIFKGSQLPGLVKGGAEGLKQSWRAMMNLAKSGATAAERKQLTAEVAEMLAKKGLTSPQVEALIGNSIKIEIAEASAKALAASRDLIMKKIRDIAAAGLAAGKANFKETIEGSLRDLLKKSFNKSLSGIVEAGVTVIGGTTTEIIDNIVGGYIDSKVTEWIATALALPPSAAQMSGSYSGSLTIASIDGVEPGGSADIEGCDIDLGALIGRALPITITLSMGEGGSGTATLELNDGPMTGTATYGGGTIEISIASEGKTMTMSGDVAFAGERIVMSGSFVMPLGEDGGDTVMMRGSWTAAKQ